jgi:hypothetical protein
MLSTSVGVRSRKRKQSKDFKKPKQLKPEGDMEKGDGEDAFIFFRPKKGKK